MKRLTLSLLPLLVAACTHTAPPADNIPYPQTDLQAEVNRLGLEVSRLQLEMEAVKQELHSRHHNVPQPKKRTVSHQATPSATPVLTTVSPEKNALAKARQLFKRKQFSAIPRILAYAENGGDGRAVARNSMYLLILSHWKMAHCESVINLTGRFTSRFSDSITESSEALWLTGLCQDRMQQKDIAKETWQKLIHTYPKTPAARRAQLKLKR